MFTISKGMKRDDVSMPILKVSPGQDLGTQLQKRSWRNPPNASQTWYLRVLLGALSGITRGSCPNASLSYGLEKENVGIPNPKFV